ncbi:hypothetical protein D9758_017095 [Tetrapyrgos nigripes]|uniref:Uncharacterized protein n=1 Tax=Tetrapyrgos nigripes TaxID=182062 RepID=A0A8H5FF30_9AGAR|nr:hypothetical protein D9758_017095 [Tetrapyrgos nigripes]
MHLETLLILVFWVFASAPSSIQCSWPTSPIAGAVDPNINLVIHQPRRPTLTIPTNCSSPPPQTCTFYAGCLEPAFHCGPEGYPLGFGEKFCTKFSLPSNIARLSPKGQEWMYTTMHCLQVALVPMLQAQDDSESEGSSSSTSMPHSHSDSDACDNLEKEAFSTHAPCYLSSGLCKLTPADWVVIVEIIDLKTLFQSWEAFESSVQAAEGCLAFFGWVLVNKVIAWIERRDLQGDAGLLPAP